MGLIRLGICVALDSALTIVSAGMWIPMSSCEMGGCFTAREMRFQREKEALKEVVRIIQEDRKNEPK